MESYVQRNPKDLKTRMELAQLQEKQGATDQARATYEAILKDDPTQEKALLHVVAILEKSNDKAALKTYYQKLAALQPKNKLVHFNLGVLCYEGKNWPEAAKAFEAVAGLDGKDIDSRKYLLDLYRKQGNQKGELEMLQNLARLQPGEKISAVMPVRGNEFKEQSRFVVMATRNGGVKKTRLDAFKNLRRKAIWAILLDEGDDLLVHVIDTGEIPLRHAPDLKSLNWLHLSTSHVSVVLLSYAIVSTGSLRRRPKVTQLMAVCRYCSISFEATCLVNRRLK